MPTKMAAGEVRVFWGVWIAVLSLTIVPVVCATQWSGSAAPSLRCEKVVAVMEENQRWVKSGRLVDWGQDRSNRQVSTNAPATNAPATNAPATNAPATNAPATNAPATNAPATNAPATNAPATNAPATKAPATNAPASKAPVAATTVAPDTTAGGGGDSTATDNGAVSASPTSPSSNSGSNSKSPTPSASSSRGAAAAGGTSVSPSPSPSRTPSPSKTASASSGGGSNGNGTSVPASNQTTSSGLPVGAIVGIVAGAILLIGVVAAGVLVLWKRKKCCFAVPIKDKVNAVPTSLFIAPSAAYKLSERPLETMAAEYRYVVEEPDDGAVVVHVPASPPMAATAGRRMP